MIKKISIKNYKSIVDDEIELGRVNVFIGANGAGKSNILEAVAMFSAAKNGDLSIEGLVNRGVRITKPDLMTNSFHDEFENNKIEITLIERNPKGEMGFLSKSVLVTSNTNDANHKWIDEYAFSEFNEIETKEARKAKKELRTILKKQVIKNNDSLDENTENKVDAIIDTLQELVVKGLVENYPNTTLNFIPVSLFQIYTLSTPALRGITKDSRKQPLGLNGENLDILLSSFNEEEWQLLRDYSHFISWLDDVFVDENDRLKFEGRKLGRSTSTLYFVDQFMRKNNNIFAAENANEGALYVLFYLALFISKKTPSFFAIDNIETALNPKICRALMKAISELAEITGKQVLITTHNPAILDGINLTEQRLFVVSRTDEGHTKTKRIEFKPGGNQQKRKLSEYWMRGDLGGIPNNFI